LCVGYDVGFYFVVYGYDGDLDGVLGCDEVVDVMVE